MILRVNSMNTDRGFQALLMNGEVSSSFYTSPILDDIGESTADLFSCLNPSSPLIHYSYAAAAYPNVYADENEFVIKDEMSTAVAGFVPDNNIIVPKIEPAEPFNFSTIPLDLDPTPISRVYDLSVTDSIAESTRLRDWKTMDSLVNNFQLSSYLTGVKYPLCKQESPMPPMPEEVEMYTSSLARNRRQKYSDKIRCLQKILPWDKKMNMTTMLEEAYKYVKFLQTQVSILQSMPYNSSTSLSSSSSHTTNTSIPGDFYGGLGKLNRQQLLQVLVNSPVAQTLLYSRGCCVYSVEQLAMFRELEKTNANQTVPFDPHSLM